MLVKCLLESASRHTSRTAVSDPMKRLTYGQLVTLARVVRRIVLSQTKREAVGLMLPASAGGLACLFGVLWAGRKIVPLNFLLQPRELKPVIDDAGLDLLLSTVHLRSLASQLPVRTLYLEELGLKRRYVFEKLRRTPPAPPAEADDVACILYTSGTTGQPKGVCLTHGNFVSNARAAIQQLQLGPDERFLGVVPPFHIFGLSVLHFLPVVLGASVTYIPRFSPQAMYRTIVNDAISILLAVPSMYGAMARLKELDPAAFRNIRIAASGGEALPRTVYNLVRERTGLTIVEGYGLTESSPIISVDLPWAHRVGTVGPPLDGVQVQLRGENGEIRYSPAPGEVVDASDGNPPEGELYVRGPLVMQGYYNRPEETAAAIDPQGWLRTGDLVRVDEAGYLQITGRAKDLIIVAGENVMPREVENVLEQHPAVAEAAVVGRQDGIRGEAVVAFVTLREGDSASDDELRSFCRERLANFKIPREVYIRSDLPRGPTGKVLKRELMPQKLPNA